MGFLKNILKRGDSNMENLKFKNFYRRLRHLRLSNWFVFKYSLKSVGCLSKGDHELEGFVRVYELANSESIFELPLTYIDYEVCIEYAKLIRRTLAKNAEFIDTIQFTTTELFGIYRKNLSAHLESCFIFVAEYCGFKVEKCCDGTIFNLKSVLP